MSHRPKRVYLFEEGNAGMRDLLGGKGAGLAEMTRVGLPVPPGFTITTGVCREFNALGKLPPDLMDEVLEKLRVIESKTGKKFGDESNPLLVSVRSGAPMSMPGMMDTILNLGLNRRIAQGLSAQTGSERFVYDAYRRFIQMFSSVVLGLDRSKFEAILEKAREKEGVRLDSELSAEALKTVLMEYERLVQREIGKPFPDMPLQQLEMAIAAVIKSWNNPRAATYRKLNRISEDMGTAVNVQAMVFGNTGENSGSGVVFTRDPSTGEKMLFGELLFNAQGEDVVAGIRTPVPVEELKDQRPELYEELRSAAELLEKHYREMQDTEFTFENGRLFMLQTRTGKRTAHAAVKIAVDMAKEGLISREEAIMRVSPEQIDQLLHRTIDPKAKIEPIAKGLNASPGAAIGRVTFTADEAEKLGKAGEKVILVRTETTPSDIHGMAVSQGVLTSRGGMTSHAAVVARGMGIPCVAGCEQIIVEANALRVGEIVVKKGEIITIDGTAGKVYLGSVPTIEPALTPEAEELLLWADGLRRLGVRANADTPNMARIARQYGAQGIGLCRTERMFNDPSRLPIVQHMIMSDTLEERREALGKLLPFQRDDFLEIFRAMDGYPVTIRLLDPPLHEFLPRYEELVSRKIELKFELERRHDVKAEEQLAYVEKQIARVEALREFNPMLGHRGCRLGLTNPEIYEMQARAIFEAATKAVKEGRVVKLQIMLPLISLASELKFHRERIEQVAYQVQSADGVELEYKIGTMIEVPRAALTADEIAAYADFFSYGTNDITQTTFGYSRDDAEGKFLQYYVEHDVLPANPFETLDRSGVGKLLDIGVKLGRKTKPELEIGICGEHGGDPGSIEFCHQVGLTYVSCSPYRVPIARLTAAQASLREKGVVAPRRDL